MIKIFDINLNEVTNISNSSDFVVNCERFLTDEEYRNFIMDIVNTINYIDHHCIVTNIRMKSLLES